MKILRYKFLSCEINHGTEESPVIERLFIDKQVPLSEANYAIALSEAYNGEVTVEEAPDPETPDTPATPADDLIWEKLDKAYQEGVDSV